VEILTRVHQGLGYVVALAVLTVVVVAFTQARDAREFTPGAYVAAAVLLDIQVLGGLVIYGMGQYWEHDSALLTYVHPTLAILALVAAHVGVKRARGHRMAVDAHQAAGKGLLIALVLVFGAVMAATLGVRGILA